MRIVDLARTLPAVAPTCAACGESCGGALTTDDGPICTDCARDAATCPTCDGSGGGPDAALRCPSCRGTGAA